MLLEKTLESSLNSKEIKPVNPKGNQSWIFILRTDTEAKDLILWSPDAKSWLIRKGPDAGKDWRQEEKGTSEDEMVGWHHQLSGHEIEQAPGDSEGQRSLVCCGSWGHKELDVTEWLNKGLGSPWFWKAFLRTEGMGDWKAFSTERKENWGLVNRKTPCFLWTLDLRSWLLLSYRQTKVLRSRTISLFQTCSSFILLHLSKWRHHSQFLEIEF